MDDKPTMLRLILAEGLCRNVAPRRKHRHARWSDLPGSSGLPNRNTERRKREPHQECMAHGLFIDGPRSGVDFLFEINLSRRTRLTVMLKERDDPVRAASVRTNPSVAAYCSIAAATAHAASLSPRSCEGWPMQPSAFPSRCT
jgi:hypothetical protein